MNRRTFLKGFASLFTGIMLPQTVSAEEPKTKEEQSSAVDVFGSSKKQYQTDDYFGLWVGDSYFKASKIEGNISCNPIAVASFLDDKYQGYKPGMISGTMVVIITDRDLIWQLGKLSKFPKCGNFEKVAFKIGNICYVFTDCVLSEIDQFASVSACWYDTYTLTFHGGKYEYITLV